MNEPQVYYDPVAEILFTVHFDNGKGRILIGNPCEYYNDAITTVSRYSISREYFNNCQKINRESPLLANEFTLYNSTNLSFLKVKTQKDFFPAWDYEQFRYQDSASRKAYNNSPSREFDANWDDKE